MRAGSPLLPFIVTLAGVALFSLMDALMKGASLAVGAYSALLLRSILALAIALPAWLAWGRRRPDARAMRVHVLRGVVASGMAFTFFWGIARLPMAEAIALSFTAPLLALYFAALTLGESIGKRAVAASLLGLAGVIVMVAARLGNAGGGGEDEAWGIAAVLFSSFLYAWNLVLQRRQALLAGPLEITTFQNLVVSAVLLLGAPWLLTLPHGQTWLGIAGAALLSVAAAGLLAWAYARAEAQVLVPLEYSGFLWAALFGWLFFAETVGPAVLAGAGLIVVACILAAPRRRTEPTVT